MALNIGWHFALDIRHEPDAYLCEKTLRNCRSRLLKLGLEDVLFRTLYLKGISTGDFSKALQALVGERAKGLSVNVVVRLKEQWSDEYEEWSKRDLSQKQYVYAWADGIHVNVRLEDDANKNSAFSC